MKAYNQDLRDRVINMYNPGIKRKEISKLLSIHYEIIRLWIRMYPRFQFKVRQNLIPYQKPD